MLSFMGEQGIQTGRIKRVYSTASVNYIKDQDSQLLKQISDLTKFKTRKLQIELQA